ncbi:hypothetical protein L1049_023994 [Liquidambar formosana]|uniref:Glycerol-3-phosphate acyltransferase RAM2/GPAT1-8 HAD-like domain-containing protein n=1 Tax=Liquidambar formosana TaxID=63359 RepID=A0AAP0RUI9_LIQFO
MVFLMVLVKLADWLLYQLLANSCYKAARKMRSYGFFLRNPSLRPSQQPLLFPSVTKCGKENRGSDTLVCDIHAVLLRSHSFFPYFMLVAFEGGSIIRAFFLLLSCPLLLFLDYELKLRVMIFITFCGLRLKDMESVGRAVLPKFYLENLNLQAYEVLASTGSRVVFTSVPRVMVKGFLKEYLNVDDVIGTELHTVGKYYTGLLSGSGLLVKHRALKEFFGEKNPEIGLGSSSLHDHLFISLCKEAYVVNKEDRKSSANSVTPRDRYPKPLIFHDGRLAFLPTPLATLSMFMWLPLGIILAIFRLFVGIFLPYKLAFFLGSWSGVNIRVKGSDPSRSDVNKGVLYVCTHRTLLDPVFLSLSLADEIVPVAMNTHVSMFYGTTASGFKWLDPILFFMNPRPSYYVHILGKVPRELTCAGGKPSYEVANHIQRLLADALGFECTTLTRRDKYMMLAGNEGVVQDKKKKPKSTN